MEVDDDIEDIAGGDGGSDEGDEGEGDGNKVRGKLVFGFEAGVEGVAGVFVDVVCALAFETRETRLAHNSIIYQALLILQAKISILVLTRYIWCFILVIDTICSVSIKN